MGVGFEKRGHARIAQRLEDHADASGRIVRTRRLGLVPQRRDHAKELKLVTKGIETPHPATYGTADRHDLKPDAPRRLPERPHNDPPTDNLTTLGEAERDAALHRL